VEYRVPQQKRQSARGAKVLEPLGPIELGLVAYITCSTYTTFWVIHLGRKLFFSVGLLSCALGLSAATITFDLTSGNGTGNGTLRTFTDAGSGITVTATAWSLLNYGTTFSTGQLGQFSTGLGVCNANEGNNCSSPDHQVDNAGSFDFVLFQFNQPVTINTIVIDPYAPANADRDVTYYLSDNLNPIPLTLTTVSALSGQGFSGPTSQSNSASLNPLPITIASGPDRAILFGASIVGGNDDYFKIASLTVTTSVVPEPEATWTLCGALAALVLYRKRRATRA